MRFQLDPPAGIAATDFDLKMIFAGKLYEGLITSGQGSKMAGISRRAFIELLGKYGVDAFQSTEDEILEDIENA